MPKKHYSLKYCEGFGWQCNKMLHVRGIHREYWATWVHGPFCTTSADAIRRAPR